MNKEVTFYISIMLLGVFISSVSQVMLKKASMMEYSSYIQEYTNPLVIIAYMLFLIATFCSIYAYKAIPLFWGPIIESSGYLFVTMFGVLLFGEKINWKKGISLFTVVAGILIFSLT